MKNINLSHAANDRSEDDDYELDLDQDDDEEGELADDKDDQHNAASVSYIVGDDHFRVHGDNGDDDKSMKMISHLLKHCTGVVLSEIYTVDAVLQWLSSSRHIQLSTLCIHGGIDDDRLRSFSELCTGLQELQIPNSRQLTDASIISISTHFSGLKLLNVSGCL